LNPRHAGLSIEPGEIVTYDYLLEDQALLDAFEKAGFIKKEGAPDPPTPAPKQAGG
jgi:hypothetical protein